MAKEIEAPQTPSELLQKKVLGMMATMKENYTGYPEYNTIMMNLTTISKELNAIKLKEVKGEEP